MRTFRHLPYILNINFLANINHHQHSSTTLPLLPFIWANHFDIVSTNWKDPLNPRATALSVMMMRWTWSFIHSFHANILSQSQRCRHFGCSCGDDGDGTFWGNSSASFDRPFFFFGLGFKEANRSRGLGSRWGPFGFPVFFASELAARTSYQNLWNHQQLNRIDQL